MNFFYQAKKAFVLIIFFLSGFFILSSNIFALTNDQSQAWFCAKTTWCNGKNCQEGTLTLKNGHRVRLEVDPNNKILPNNSETYLVECLSYTVNKELKWVCTTGDSQLDLSAFNSDNFSQLSADIGYSLTKDANYGIYLVENQEAVRIGSKTYATGPSSGLMIKDSNNPASVFEWQSYTPEGHDRKFYFLQKISPVTNPDVGTGGQQQATSFDWVNADKDCAVVHWDPAGRVFDAYTLEPIPNARVFLTKDKGDGQFVDASQLELGIVNPQTTGPQGSFSYFVSDGDYQLNVLNFYSLGYSKVADSLSDINSNYKNIYYYLENGVRKTYIYPTETGEIIQQRGKIQYRDIPLLPISYAGKTYPLKVISGFQSVDRLTGNFIFEGSVSHPFTNISIYGVTNDNQEELIIQQAADNFGRYKILFPQNNEGKSYKEFKVNFDKVDLRSFVHSRSKFRFEKLISWLESKFLVFGQEGKNRLTFTLKPIPTYIEGIAYDENGNILANQEVKVYVEGSNVPYSSVKTDEKGYYVLGSDQLPSVPYRLIYSLPTGKIQEVTTSKVINDNKDLFVSSKISYYTLKNNQGKFITPTIKEARGNFTPVSSPTLFEKGYNQQREVNKGLILLIVMIMSVVIITGVAIYFYLRQRHSPPSYPSV